MLHYLTPLQGARHECGAGPVMSRIHYFTSIYILIPLERVHLELRANKGLARCHPKVSLFLSPKSHSAA